MLGIIMYHIVRYHIDYNRFALVSPDTGSNFYHLEVIQLFYTFGQLGNTLFIFITGYFLIIKKEINVIKAGGNSLLRAYLVAIVLLVASHLFVYSSNSNYLFQPLRTCICFLKAGGLLVITFLLLFMLIFS